MIIKQYEEITETEALRKKYRDGRVPIYNCDTNKNEYRCVTFLLLKHCELFVFLLRRCWICNCTNIQTSATFDYGHPPIIIVSFKPISRRSDEGYESNPVRLRNIKDTLRICSVKYVIIIFFIFHT